MLNDYFDLREFVHPKIYSRYGERSIQFIDYRLIELAVTIREYFNKPMIINNWHEGGRLKNRGLRLPNSKVGAYYSQHKFGRAIDFNIVGMTSDEVYEELLKVGFTLGATTIEDNNFATTWTHIDIRHTGLEDRLLIVQPKID